MKHKLELESKEVLDLLAFFLLTKMMGRVPPQMQDSHRAIGIKLLALREEASKAEDREAANAR